MTSNYNMPFTIMVVKVSKNSKFFCTEITCYVNQYDKIYKLKDIFPIYPVSTKKQAGQKARLSVKGF